MEKQILPFHCFRETSELITVTSPEPHNSEKFDLKKYVSERPNHQKIFFLKNKWRNKLTFKMNLNV